MTSVAFTMTFHSPFRVGAAASRDGVAAALDRHNPLPGDHLKGLMRATALDVLHLDHAQVAEVFGGKGRAGGAARDRAEPCAWTWDAVRPDTDWHFRLRHRVAIDRDTHTAVEDHLVSGEQAWAGGAGFEIIQMDRIPDDRLDWHRLVLRAAGAGVHHLGAWRRRGLGWVTLTPADALTDTDIDQLISGARGRG
jgi:CRISPR/Cas system CSM-associated protein Csm3 (group 7 of RAMP superfamily)